MNARSSSPRQAGIQAKKQWIPDSSATAVGNDESHTAAVKIQLRRERQVIGRDSRERRDVNADIAQQVAWFHPDAVEREDRQA